MYNEEQKRRVIAAALKARKHETVQANAENIAQETGVHVSDVRTIVKELGVQISDGVDLVFSRPVVERLEAYLSPMWPSAYSQSEWDALSKADRSTSWGLLAKELQIAKDRFDMTHPKAQEAVASIERSIQAAEQARDSYALNRSGDVLNDRKGGINRP